MKKTRRTIKDSSKLGRVTRKQAYDAAVHVRSNSCVVSKKSKKTASGSVYKTAPRLKK